MRKGTKTIKVKSVIVPNTITNYNKYRKMGYKVLWSGEGKLNFIKPIKRLKK